MRQSPLLLDLLVLTRLGFFISAIWLRFRDHLRSCLNGVFVFRILMIPWWFSVLALTVSGLLRSILSDFFIEIQREIAGAVRLIRSGWRCHLVGVQAGVYAIIVVEALFVLKSRLHSLIHGLALIN